MTESPGDQTAGDETEQKERRDRVAAVFDKVAGSYDSVGVPWFTPIAERLVRELAPAPGERAVDIGCGRGAALFALAQAVGPAGHVMGIDLAPAMVESTSKDAEGRGLDWVEIKVRDAAKPDLPSAEYALATASLVLFFLPDPLSALRSWRDAIAPGGRLGITTFGEQDARWQTVEAVFRPYLPPQMLDPRTSGRTGPFASNESITMLVGAAGFERVRTFSEELSVTFADADQWRIWSQSHGQRAMWDAIPDSELDTVTARLYQRLADASARDGSIELKQEIRYTIGYRPS